MKFFRPLLFSVLLIAFLGSAQAQVKSKPTKNDTITLAQAYMNLYLTETYFDTISVERTKKILAFENDEIKSIKDSSFIGTNSTLYNFTNALFYQNQSKLLYLNKGEVSRGLLRRLKSTLDRAINYYNSAKIDDDETFQNEKNKLYEMIKFDSESNETLTTNIRSLKKEFNSLFNEDIFPDFKRIFLSAKNTDRFYIDSLSYIAGIYNIPLNRDILNNFPEYHQFTYEDPNYINPEFTADSRLDIISKYIQLKYLASKRTRVPRNFNNTVLYDAYNDFISQVNEEDDKFIKEELNPTVCKMLLSELTSKFPRNKNLEGREQIISAMSMTGESSTDLKNYFFPNPAPHASAKFIVSSYKPALSTLGQVDSFLRTGFANAGFKNELHYYYDMDGFALTTSLEKFNINGSPVPAASRFIKNLGGDGKFSYYEIFKSLFFEVESEFRMFAFIVASKPATMNNDVMTAGFAEAILKNSYDILPKELKNTSLPTKVLSIFVYHFHQNDISSTVQLDLSGKLSVQDHLKNAGLIKIIQ
ncbi:hypothetical protein SYJ56_20180 [Algoriphagus sp. D3-2-R+10]|uniref:hypothetical protein n=1 Tax=Algoriphagus aurantiacus TaxID=3103948 RepID=UPI002B38233C|nr:hypothetical protein [Algoriphagus sp. D3-2-R+10]MEB2777646.1 hypothetical protein [Algoriphagus sp. D3-2-R+10]